MDKTVSKKLSEEVTDIASIYFDDILESLEYNSVEVLQEVDDMIKDYLDSNAPDYVRDSEYIKNLTNRVVEKLQTEIELYGDSTENQIDDIDAEMDYLREEINNIDEDDIVAIGELNSEIEDLAHIKEVYEGIMYHAKISN